jgi:hypothetical protein
MRTPSRVGRMGCWGNPPVTDVRSQASACGVEVESPGPCETHVYHVGSRVGEPLVRTPSGRSIQVNSQQTIPVHSVLTLGVLILLCVHRLHVGAHGLKLLLSEICT